MDCKIKVYHGGTKNTKLHREMTLALSVFLILVQKIIPSDNKEQLHLQEKNSVILCALHASVVYFLFKFSRITQSILFRKPLYPIILTFIFPTIIGVST